VICVETSSYDIRAPHGTSRHMMRRIGVQRLRFRTFGQTSTALVRFMGSGVLLAALTACGGSGSTTPAFVRPAGSTTIEAMALVNEGTFFSHGLVPDVQLYTYDSAGKLLAGGTPFDAPVVIASAGGSGCLSSPVLTVQTTDLSLSAFIGAVPPPNCSYSTYGISATATSPLSAISGSLLSVGPADPFLSMTIQFAGLSRLSGTTPATFTFGGSFSPITALESTSCPPGMLTLTLSANVVTVAPPTRQFTCTATFNPGAFSGNGSVLTITST
jgi:hypothetical protein